ncbi:MAG: hypothetical protein GX539_09700, partial [Candidatus Cloacimonetes bacterium]|nr:hypothetical protein [Candidatus Cloacimonadota bacterium]
GSVNVLLPRSLAYARVVADGQLLLEKEGSAVHTQGDVVEQSDNVIVFRIR